MFKANKYILPIFSAKVEYAYEKQMTLLLEDINEFYSELLNNLINEKTVDYMEIIETVKSIITIKIICIFCCSFRLENQFFPIIFFIPFRIRLFILPYPFTAPIIMLSCILPLIKQYTNNVGNVAITSAAPTGPQSDIYCPKSSCTPTGKVLYLESDTNTIANMNSFHAFKNVKMAIVENAGFISGRIILKKMP